MCEQIRLACRSYSSYCARTTGQAESSSLSTRPPLHPEDRLAGCGAGQHRPTLRAHAVGRDRGRFDAVHGAGASARWVAQQIGDRFGRQGGDRAGVVGGSPLHEDPPAVDLLDDVSVPVRRHGRHRRIGVRAAAGDHRARRTAVLTFRPATAQTRLLSSSIPTRDLVEHWPLDRGAGGGPHDQRLARSS